jgi:hypothetical protein
MTKFKVGTFSPVVLIRAARTAGYHRTKPARSRRPSLAIGHCLRRQNHFFDALYYAAAAGWYCGVRLEDEPAARVTRPKRSLEEMARAARLRSGL